MLPTASLLAQHARETAYVERGAVGQQAITAAAREQRAQAVKVRLLWVEEAKTKGGAAKLGFPALQRCYDHTRSSLSCVTAALIRP